MWNALIETKFSEHLAKHIVFSCKNFGLKGFLTMFKTFGLRIRAKITIILHKV